MGRFFVRNEVVQTVYLSQLESLNSSDVHRVRGRILFRDTVTTLQHRMLCWPLGDQRICTQIRSPSSFQMQLKAFRTERVWCPKSKLHSWPVECRSWTANSLARFNIFVCLATQALRSWSMQLYIDCKTIISAVRISKVIYTHNKIVAAICLMANTI